MRPAGPWSLCVLPIICLGLAHPASAETGSAAAGDSRTTLLAEEIIVYGRVPQRIDQVGSAVSTFRAEDIALQDLRVLSDVLERLPGVAITRSGGFGQTTQVRMRGFTTKHVLTIVDGVKINNPSAFDNQFGIQHLTLANIERVEVLRGPQSGLYGADAVAGVINIVTRRGFGPVQGRISGLAGSYESRELSAAISGGLAADRVGLALGASWFDTEGISVASRAPGNVEPDGYRNLTLSLRVDWEAAPGVALRAGARYTDSRNETDSNFTQNRDPRAPFFRPDLPPFLFQDSDGFAKDRQGIAYVGANVEQAGGLLIHDLQLSLVDLRTRVDQPTGATRSRGETFEAQYFATVRLGKAGLFGPESFAQIGADWKEERAVFEQLRGFPFATIDDGIGNSGVFTTANLDLGAGIFLSLAARYDLNESFGGVATGRVAAAWNDPFPIARGLSVKLRGSYGTGREAPGIRQLRGRSPTFIGNPDLVPEETWMVDGGLDLAVRDLGTLSLTYYHGEADRGIFNVFDPALRVSRPQNIDSVVRMYGLEVEGAFRPASWLRLSGWLTSARSRIVATGVQLFGRPKLEGGFAVTLTPVEPLILVADGYARGRFFSDFPSTFEMPGYEVVNASATWRATDWLELQARIGNIFDKRYETKLGDGTFGRHWSVRASLRF